MSVLLLETLLVMHGHDVHLVKRFGARRTFTHAIADAIIHTLVAEKMAAGLQGRVLEIVAADGTQSIGLFIPVSILEFILTQNCHLPGAFLPPLKSCSMPCASSCRGPFARARFAP
jgi:hypothetical protein